MADRRDRDPFEPMADIDDHTNRHLAAAEIARCTRSMSELPDGIELFVPGKPVAQGSKRHVGHGRMIEMNKDLGPWRERVALAAHSAMDGRKLLPGAITCALSFVLSRPKSAPKRSTPPASKRPDIDKLTRAILDAITNVMILDDSQVTNLHACKRLAEIGETPGVLIRVESDE